MRPKSRIPRRSVGLDSLTLGAGSAWRAGLTAAIETRAAVSATIVSAVPMLSARLLSARPGGALAVLLFARRGCGRLGAAHVVGGGDESLSGALADAELPGQVRAQAGTAGAGRVGFLDQGECGVEAGVVRVPMRLGD